MIGDKRIGDPKTGNPGTDRRGTERKHTDNRGLPPEPPARHQLAAVDEVVFPDVVVGEVVKSPVLIFNVHPSKEAKLQAKVEVTRDRPGDVAPFQIVSAPTRLRPSHEGLGEPVVIAFQSQRTGDYAGTLVVFANWGGYPMPMERRIEIRLRGWTRAEGDPLRADVLAAEAASQAAARAARDKAAREAAMQRRYEQETDASYPQSKANELERQYGLALVALHRLTRAQFAAIPVVKDETKMFKRRPPPESHVFAKALARFAFDVATAGIAGRVAARVTKAFSTRVKYVRPEAAGIREELPGGRITMKWLRTEGPPKAEPISALLSPEGMAALDEMVQATVKGTLLEIGSAIATDAPADRAHAPSAARSAGNAPVSSVAEIQFFYDQTEEISDEEANRETSLVNLHALLKPSLRREADAAITAMRALVASLEAEKELAGKIQASQTRQSWMSFLSQNSVGSLSPAELRRRGLHTIDDTVMVTDAARIAQPTSGGKVPLYDGVLDVYVRANRQRPLDAISIERVNMTGVILPMLGDCFAYSGLVADRRVARFGDLRIALRVIAVASGIEDFGVVVTRDEAGNVFSSDTTGALPQDSNWLARRAGHQRTSRALQQEGAVHFMNEVLRNEIIWRISTDEA